MPVPRWCVLALVGGTSAATTTVPERWWSLVDLSPADVRALGAAGLDDACLAHVRARLQAEGAPPSFLDGTKPLDSLADANRVYAATQRALGVAPSSRADAARCVTRGECAWLLALARTVCGRAPDAGLFARMTVPSRLFGWLVRGVSAFLLPGGDAASSRRSLGLLDGAPTPAAAHRPTAGPPTASLNDVMDVVAQIKQALEALGASSARGGASPASVDEWMRHIASGRRRLGLWGPQSFGESDQKAKMRAFVRAVPTLRTDAEREAAMRAMEVTERALAQFATSVYFELPTPKKMLVARIVRKDEAALYELLEYLKGTSLVRSVRGTLAFDRTEVADALAYAAGDAARFDRVAASLARRVTSLTAAERAASMELLRAAPPAVRALGVGVAWLDQA